MALKKAILIAVLFIWEKNNGKNTKTIMDMTYI